MRRRGEVVIGVRRSEGSEVREAWPADLIGWPPQPVVWHIWRFCSGQVTAVRGRVEVAAEGEWAGHTILYIGTAP